LARREKNDMQMREGKGNGPCKGPSGTSGKTTGHEEMRVYGRRRTRKGNYGGENGLNNMKVQREEIRNRPGLG
jgi:hypothetical protein